MYIRFFFSVCLTAIHAGAALAANDLPAARASLRQAGPQPDASVLADAVEVVRSEMKVGDAQSWMELKAVLDDSEAPDWVRTQLAGVLLDKTDRTIALDIVGLMDSWSRELAAGSHSDDTKVVLLGMFIDRFDSPPFRESVLASPATLQMLSRVYVESYCSLETKQAALRAISASTAAREDRRCVAEDIVSRQPRSTQVATELLRMMGPSSFPTLRALVRRSTDVDSFVFAGAAALAHLGDREILPDLISLRSAFRGQSKSAGAYLDLYIWQVQVQDPPTKLLEYIKSRADLGAPARRVWAIGRASDLGLSAEEIREAILAHASTVPSTQKIDPRSGRSYNVRPGLATIKEEAVRLGILLASDLPDVATMEL